MALSLFAESVHKKLSIEEALPILEPIMQFAMHIGEGSSDIYVFVDPLCPHSRNFIDLIANSEKMQARYSYHIFLLRLEKFDSANSIEQIYSCVDELECLEDVMLSNKSLHVRSVTRQTKKMIGTIQEVAKTLDAYKRPYLLIRRGE